KVYFAGDTALTLEMKLLEDLQLDWAFLPIGGHYTMDADDAIKAAYFVNCKNIIGIHYDTFPPISIDTAEAKKKFEARGLHLHLPQIGESIILEGPRESAGDAYPFGVGVFLYQGLFNSAEFD